MKTQGSLRTRIITWSFVPTVIILISVALVTFYSYQQVTEDLVMSQSSELVRYKAAEVSEVMIDLLNPSLIDFIFNVDADKGLPLIERAEKVRTNTKLRYVFDGGIVFLDRDGKIIFTDPAHPEMIGVDWSQMDFFLASQERPGVDAVTGTIADIGLEQDTVLPITLGLRDENANFAGAAVFMLGLNSEHDTPFYLGMRSQFLDENILIIDGANRVVFHPDRDQIGRNYSDRAEFEPLFAGKVEVVNDHVESYRTSNGKDVISSVIYPVSPTNHWWIIKQQPWKDLMEPSLGYRRLLMILLAAGVIVPVGVVTYGARRLTQPIEQMITAAKEVANGKFGQKIEADSGDELEELASQFNTMSSELEQSYALLEQRVADRTRELETLNTVSGVVNRSLDLEEILSNALEKTIEITNMDAGVAYRYNPATQIFELLAHIGLSDAYVSGHRFLHANMVNQEVDTNSAVVTAAFIDEYPVPGLREDLKAEGVQVAMRLPLISKGKVMGYLGLSKSAPEPLTEDEVRVFIAIGQQVSVAMENAALYEAAEETAVTAERNRLARDLHDAVTQTLFSASLIAEVLPELYKINPGEAAQRTEELRELSRGALAEMRTLLLELRPSALTQVSLKELLTQLSEAVVGRTRIPVKFTAEGERAIPDAVQVALYRITQEALNNVVKYAHANEVRLELLQTKGFVEISVRDDGIGFEEKELSHNHLGLKIMRERAEAIGAELRIVSQPGKGTHVTVTWCEFGCMEEE